MGEEEEEENVRFFDAREESFSKPYPHLSEELEIAEPVFRYEIWAQCPGSVGERRDRFLEWMGKMGLDCSEDNYANICILEEEEEEEEEEGDNRVMETSGAELRSLDWSSESLDWSEEFVSTNRENGCSLDYMDENLVDKEEKKVAGSSSMCSLSFQQLFDDSDNIAATPSRTMKGWLKRFRSFSCVLDSEDEGEPESERLQKVRVRHCGKKSKELSGLFTGQDFQAHTGAILKMKFSPDGQFLATVGEDRVVRVWRVVEEERCNEADIPQIDPSCIYFTVNRFSELKQFFFENEKMAKLRKTSDSACIVFPPKVFRLLETPVHEFCGHGDEILDLSWSNTNFLLTASADKTVRLWQVGCNHSIKVFEHSNYVSSVQFNPVDDECFVSGSIDGKVRIWAVDSCQVVDWIDIRDIVTAVCYRPDGEEVIVGSMSGNCRFYSISDNHLELDAEICLCSKKKSPCKRITGFEFCPRDSSKVMVSCADSQIRILQGGNVVGRYRGRGSANLSSSSFTVDGKHIISASEDSNVYIWNCNDHNRLGYREPKLTKSCERFMSNASVAIPWSGMRFRNSDETFPCSPVGFSLGQGLFLETFQRGTATWPEEQLPFWSPLASSQAMNKTHYKLLKSSCRSTSHAWGLVIVTAGWDGRIRSFLNYGLPIPT